jgi:hypothetical protein
MPRPKKADQFRLTSFPNRSGTRSWKVSGTKVDGTRVRLNFGNKSEAIRERNDLELEAAGHQETHRVLRTSFTAPNLADAEAAAQQATPPHLSKIVGHYLSLRRRPAKFRPTLQRG